MKLNSFLKNKLIIFLLFVIIFCIFSFIYSLLIYYDLLKTNNESFKIISFVIGLLSFFILGLISGIICKENGLINGLLNSLIVIFLGLIINIFIGKQFMINNFIKIASYIISSSIGGILGVNIFTKNR